MRRHQLINKIYSKCVTKSHRLGLDKHCGAWPSDVALVACGHGEDGEAVDNARLHLQLSEVELIPSQS